VTSLRKEYENNYVNTICIGISPSYNHARLPWAYICCISGFIQDCNLYLFLQRVNKAGSV